MKMEFKKTLKRIGKFLMPIKPIIVWFFEIEAALAKRWVASAHKRLFLAQWGIPKNPEFFDHQIDLYYAWPKTRIMHWLERGVFSTLVIKRGGNLLEIACGDGFNARNFYCGIAGSIIACDFDKNAIKTAKRKNQTINIEFILADIRFNMPEGDFDNIVWDAAIEHFTPEEINSIMKNMVLPRI